MVKHEKSVVAAVTVGAIIGFLGFLPGGAGPVVAQSVGTTDPGQVATREPLLAERVFHVEWNAQAGSSGRSTITGYVYNDYGRAAENVELQISNLDASGNVVGKEVQRIGDTVPSRGRAYFQLQAPTSYGYRVDVIGYDFNVGHGGSGL
jgi:hypothetical protein